MDETIEQQTTDSDIIFTAISTGGFDDFKQAQQAVTMLYVTDMSFSRSGISHALKRLEEHYKTVDDDPFTEEEQRFNDQLDATVDATQEARRNILRESEENYQRRFLIAATLSLSVIVACWLLL